MDTIHFELTDEAGRMIKEFAREAEFPLDSPLRIDVIGGADSGFAYDIYFDTLKDDDLAITVGGFKLLISRDAAAYLDGGLLDWVTSDNGSGFYVDNPNEPAKT